MRTQVLLNFLEAAESNPISTQDMVLAPLLSRKPDFAVIVRENCEVSQKNLSEDLLNASFSFDETFEEELSHLQADLLGEDGPLALAGSDDAVGILLQFDKSFIEKEIELLVKRRSEYYGRMATAQTIPLDDELADCVGASQLIFDSLPDDFFEEAMDETF